jgi:hypothetical protein
VRAHKSNMRTATRASLNVDYIRTPKVSVAISFYSLVMRLILISSHFRTPISIHLRAA